MFCRHRYFQGNHKFAAVSVQSWKALTAWGGQTQIWEAEVFNGIS